MRKIQRRIRVSDNNGSSKKEKMERTERKYAYLDEWVKLTGQMAKAQAKEKGRYEVYIKNGQWVKEYPNGEIIPFSGDEND